MNTAALMNKFKPGLVIMLMLMVAFAVYKRAPEADAVDVSLEECRVLFGDAAYMEQVADNLYEVRGRGGSSVGWLLRGPAADRRITGFAGEVPFLIGISPDNRIVGVHMTDSRETASYAARVSSELRDAWNDVSPGQAANMRVDAVSGATATSRALIQGVQAALAELSEQAVDLSTPADSGTWRRLTGLAGWLFFVLALTAFIKSKNPPVSRSMLRILSVAIPGILAASMLSMSWLASLLRGDAALWSTYPRMLVLMLVAAAAPLLTGRNFYCNYYCPFGAAQILAGRLCRRKYSVKRLTRMASAARLALVAAAFITIAAGIDFDMALLEPFAAFRWTHAPYVSRGLAAIFLTTALCIQLPWCRICPTGGIIEALRRKRRHRLKS